MKEIQFCEIENIRLGHAEDRENATGCTVLLCKQGAPAGIDVRGGGPAARETQLLDPVATVEGIHGLLLSGGSAYGLDAAAGVMRYLEERDIGVHLGEAVVPLVCASCIFDLGLRNHKVRPDSEMGYRACLDAEKCRCDSGSIGAGTGATVGKLKGPEYRMKSGLGCYACQVGELKVGAVVVVNALGDVVDPESGSILAGMLNPEKNGFYGSEDFLCSMGFGTENYFVGNTTIGALVTNGRFNKTQMKKIAAMAGNGMVRTIRPVHTSGDGDTLYALSAGGIKAAADVVGSIGCRAVEIAVKRAVTSVQSEYGCYASCDILSKAR